VHVGVCQPNQQTAVQRMAERQGSMPPEMKEILSSRFGSVFNDDWRVKLCNPKDLGMHGQSIFTPAEDELLALGINRYGLDDWHIIQRELLCAKTVHQVLTQAQPGFSRPQTSEKFM
jgi:hypothetical protein